MHPDIIMTHLHQPPGLLSGWVCVITPTTPMPYFYNSKLNKTTWKIPHDPDYCHVREVQPATTLQKQKLSTLLNKRKQRIINTSIQKETNADPSYSSKEETKKVGGIISRVEEEEVTNVTKGMEHGKRPERIRIHHHPLHVARTKLHKESITDEEYSHIVKTHQMMESEQRTVVMEGELMKMGKRMGRFVTRWFVLHSDQQLSSCRSSNHRYAPTSVINLSKCICMPVDLLAEKGQSHCIEITEMHGNSTSIIAAPNVETQVAWLEAMLSTKTKTLGLGRLNVIKANAALKGIKRRAKMPSM